MMKPSKKQLRLRKRDNGLSNVGDNAMGQKDFFFVLDSCSIGEAKESLFGYAIDETGVYTDYIGGGLTGNGCYVRITIDEREIKIEQDSNGSFGLYLYRQGDYFAISNSFFRLLNFLKGRCRLSVNYDYCLSFFALGLCSIAYGETAINEIKWLDRNAVVVVDKADKALRIEYRPAAMNTVALESREGGDLLDHWFDRWTTIIKGIAARPKSLAVDLSGGFDSRLTFMLAKASGVDLTSLQVYTMDSDNKVHQQDYSIARQIAEHFGFNLERRLYSECKATDFTLDDMVNFVFDSKMAFHKDVLLWIEKMDGASFRMSGAAGELIRSYWHMNAQELMNQQLRRAGIFGRRHLSQVSVAIANVVGRAIGGICRKHSLANDSPLVGHYLYRETRCRNHFGRLMLGGMAAGIYWLSPLLDENLPLLNTRFEGCSDDNALLALIFERYCPELLRFPVEGERSVAQETIDRAREINKSFKRAMSVSNRLVRFNLPNRSSSGENLNKASIDEADSFFRRVVCSDMGKNLVVQNFSEEAYKWAVSGMDAKGFISPKPWQAMAGILVAIDNAEFSRRASESCKDALDRFLNKDIVVCKDGPPIVHSVVVSERHVVIVSGEASFVHNVDASPSAIALRIAFADTNGRKMADASAFVPVGTERRRFAHEFVVPSGAVSAMVEAAVSGGDSPIRLHGYSVSKALKKDYPDDCVRLLPVDSKYNWDRVAENMMPGREYRFSVGEVVVESGETSFVEAIVYDANTKRFCLRNKFPVSNGRCGRQEWCFVVPGQPGAYQLLVYAGVAGKTENIGVYYKNLKVELLTTAS